MWVRAAHLVSVAALFRYVAVLAGLLFFSSQTASWAVSPNAVHLSQLRTSSRGGGFRSLNLPVFVINLESRMDRLYQINNVLGSLGLGSTPKIINGIPHKCGILGSGLSHALAMSGCIDSNATACAVFEDDFELVVDPAEANTAVERFFQNQPASWEVLMLSANAVIPFIPSNEFSHLEVVTEAMTASGYVIHRSFAMTLLQTFVQAAYHLNKSKCSQARYAHDILWKELQWSQKWFALKPLIGKQRASYSDIEKREVDYNLKKIMKMMKRL